MNNHGLKMLTACVAVALVIPSVAQVPVSYCQRAQPWAPWTLGFGPSTIGSKGCVLTCFSDLSSIAGPHRDPGNLNARLKSCGGFSGDIIFWDVAARETGWRRVGDYNWQSVPAPVSFICQQLAAGRKWILEVRLSGSRHFVAAWGYSYPSMFIAIADPWYGDRLFLQNRYGNAAAAVYRGILLERQ